ncbi:MAG: S66 peptidase family protein [Chitinophagales bacterium]
MFRPDYLKRGDTICILSTARFVDLESIQPFIDWIASLGLKIRLGSTMNLKDHQFAGTDTERAQDFQNAIGDPEIKAIWFARGGYGSIRIFDDIVWDKFIENPKWLIGFSDITIWHNLANQFYGIQSIHALMPITFQSNTPEAIRHTAQMIMGEQVEIIFPFDSNNTHFEAVSGEMIGGNLSILYSLLGTKTGFNTGGKVLYIEDIDEYLYHIDRIMISLKKAGKLLGLKALVVGEFFDIKDNTIPFGKTYQEIILEHCAEYGYPIIFDFPAGHIENNHPIRLGAQVQISRQADQVKLKYS